MSSSRSDALGLISVPPDPRALPHSASLLLVLLDLCRVTYGLWKGYYFTFLSHLTGMYGTCLTPLVGSLRAGTLEHWHLPVIPAPCRPTTLQTVTTTTSHQLSLILWGLLTQYKTRVTLKGVYFLHYLCLLPVATHRKWVTIQAPRPVVNMLH